MNRHPSQTPPDRETSTRAPLSSPFGRIVLAIVFFGVVTPVALLLRLLGKDPLHRHPSDTADSYWFHRPPRGPAPATMKRPH